MHALAASRTASWHREADLLCRFFGLRASHPTSVACWLVRADNSLMAQSRRDLHGFENADGWGIAFWQDDGVRFQRRSHAAHQSEEFRSAAARVEATALLAHVRHATVGEIVDANTHPFTHGRWGFVHNGTVPYFDQIRPVVLAAMSAEHRAAIQGTTDSEHLLHLILSAAERDPDRPLLQVVRETLAQVIAWCRAIGPHPRLGLNVLLCDGTRMVGSRWQRTLSFRACHRLDACAICGARHAACEGPDRYRALMIASEPITQDPWQEVPERSVYEVAADLTLRVERLPDD